MTRFTHQTLKVLCWLAEHAVERQRMNESVLQSGGSSGLKTHAIVLVDDNAVQAATRQTILKRAGYFVIAVLNPMRALEQFQGQLFPVEIHLVITDHLMPGMNGAEFVRELRKTHGALPVMVISGLEEAEELYKDLSVHFRMKPVLPEHLLSAVHRMVTTGRADA